jgi:hypothetical protein
MIQRPDLYSGLPDGLKEMPCPNEIRFGRKDYAVPQTMDEFTNNICYGQRLFLTREEENDYGAIFRLLDGYYYPIVECLKWDEEKALLFGNKVITCKVKYIYPIAIHFVMLLKEIIDREEKLLYREPSKIELAAGIEKLNLFSELNSLDFLRDAMKCTVPEVLLTPYNECLVRFMNAKMIADYQDRYLKLQREQIEIKPKYQKE